jgi:hypothetical protein
MAMTNWCINNIPTNTWNTLLSILPGEDACVFSYKLHNRGASSANVILGITNSAIPALDPPSNIVVTPQGTAGTTTYSYRVSAVNARGETLGSTAVTTETGNLILDSINFNRITWDAVSGAIQYNVYGREVDNEKYIGTTTSLSYDDTGIITPTNFPPIINTTHIKFRFIQDNMTSLEQINSENERLALMQNDSLVIFTDNSFVDIIAFGDLLNIG